MKTYIYLVFILLISFGCAQKITVDEYYKKREKVYKPMNTLTGAVYYCGSNKKYDFILFSPGYGFRDLAKLKKGDLALDRFQYTRDRSKWLIIYPTFQTKETFLKEVKPITTPLEFKIFELK